MSVVVGWNERGTSTELDAHRTHTFGKEKALVQLLLLANFFGREPTETETLNAIPTPKEQKLSEIS